MDPMQVIEELGVPGRLPVEAIRAAQADREAMVPVFLRTIDDFLELRGPVDPDALFFIFHLLGEWREKSAYWPLAVFLRLPGDVLDTILGDSITETTHRVMAAVFDGDPNPLYDIIRDPEADEYVRAKMCQTIAMLTRRGDLPRDATAAFLRDCFSQLEPQQDCYVNVLRDAMAVDSLDSCGIYFGTTGGQVYASRDSGDSWQAIVRDLPAVLSVEVQTLA